MTPVLETARCVKYIIDVAVRGKRTDESRVPAMESCGDDLLGLKAYEDFLAGKLVDYEPANIEVQTYVR